MFVLTENITFLCISFFVKSSAKFEKRSCALFSSNRWKLFLRNFSCLYAVKRRSFHGKFPFFVKPQTFSWRTITDFTKKLMKSFYAHSILDFFCKIKVFSRKFWTEVKWFHDFILSRTEIALKIYYSWFHEILPLSHHYYSSKQLLWVRDTRVGLFLEKLSYQFLPLAKVEHLGKS